jgi:hypothetical protein
MANLPITPTTGIAATSTISGTVRAQKHITSGNITGTSTVSGTVRAKHLIKPTTSITATSTLSASFTKARVIIVSGINALSTLSGAFVLKPGNILPANIRATSFIHEINVTLKIIPAGYYGIFDIEDGIIP